ncbi:MAG: OmpA family protein [Kiloniellales bacterium]|nr:OmpA family protein [Kiloniellales bacterium]
MQKTPEFLDPGRQRPDFRCSWLAWVLVLWLPVAALACSSTGGSESDGQSGSIEDEDYPNLSRVPGEQPRPTSASLRDELIEGLAADRANARYSDEALTGTSAAPPPAAPPPDARTQVEIIWESLRVEPEGAAEEAADSDAGAAAASTAGAAAGASEGTPEEVQINWETERVEPSGKVATTGGAAVEEELILAPGPELVGVVYFASDSTQVESGDLELLEEVVALYKERGGHLRLVGHSSAQAASEDEVAQRMVNLDLSLRRANAVATTLLDLGAEKDKLMIEAKADSEPAGGPVNDEAAVRGESNDRRVEIFLEP